MTDSKTNQPRIFSHACRELREKLKRFKPYQRQAFAVESGTFGYGPIELQRNGIAIANHESIKKQVSPLHVVF